MTSLHCCLKTAFEKDTAGYRGNPLLKAHSDSDKQVESAVNNPTKGLRPMPTFNQALAQIQEDRAYVENMYDQARSEAPKLKRQSLRQLMYNDILLKTLEKEKEKRAKYLAFGMTPDEIMQARRLERENMVTEAVNTPFDQLPDHIRARISAAGGITALQADAMSFDQYRNMIEQAVSGLPQDSVNQLSARAEDGSDASSDLGSVFGDITYSNAPGEGAVTSGAGSGQGGQGTVYVPPPSNPSVASETLLSPRSPVSPVASETFSDLFDGAFPPGASARSPLADPLVGDTRPIATALTDQPSGHLRSPAIPPPKRTGRSSQMFSPSQLYTQFLQTDLDRTAKDNKYKSRIDFIDSVGTKAIKPMVETFLRNQGFNVPDRERLTPQIMTKIRQTVSSSKKGTGSGKKKRKGKGRGKK